MSQYGRLMDEERLGYLTVHNISLKYKPNLHVSLSYVATEIAIKTSDLQLYVATKSVVYRAELEAKKHNQLQVRKTNKPCKCGNIRDWYQVRKI